MGNWTQGSGGGRAHARPARELAADPTIWERSEFAHEADHALPLAERARLAHEKLTALIRDAGGIACGHALTATTYLDGETGLNDGIHRWAVASELGVTRAPVKMQREREEVPGSWDVWALR
jgi:hypothetical protein